MRHIGDDERRARIGVRHALAAGHRVPDPVAATRAMTVLHATEAPTVYLSLFARVDGLQVADVGRALYDDRALVKQLAMRRTLFVFPHDLLPAAWGSAGARVAEQERRRIGKDAVGSGMATDGDAWLDDARLEVLTLLEGTDGLPAKEIRAAIPSIAGTVSVSPGTKWGGDIPVAPRVLGWLGARGEIVRGQNAGHWRISRPAWTRTGRWLGEVPEPLDETAGYAELVRRWLRTFGPGTEADLVWWLGATKTAVRRALSDVEAEPVTLDGGDHGWVLPDDVEPDPPVEPWAALLPVLDPTTMGWRDRAFYLDPGHTPYLFDTAGNAGTTAWWNGRIVGCWVQDEDGVVKVVLREDVGTGGAAALDAEADRLTRWLEGVTVTGVYSSLQMKSARLP